MDKKIIGLMGAITTLVPVATGQAATTANVAQAMAVRSYADLLQPIPDAVALLQAADELSAQNRAKAEPPQQVAQWGGPGYYYHHHHHHHHHHNYWRRRHYHHHHHHHNYYYHHHHHNYYRPY